MSIISKLAVLVVVALSGAYIYTALRGPQGLPSVFGKAEEVRSLQRKHADLKHEVEERQKRIERLRVSKSEQELEIRKRMKFVHPGETVFIITGKPVPKPQEPVVKYPESVPAKPAAPPAIVKPIEPEVQTPPVLDETDQRLQP